MQVGGGAHMERLEEAYVIVGWIAVRADRIQIFQSTVLPITGDHERYIIRDIGTDYRNIVAHDRLQTDPASAQANSMIDADR